MGCRSQQHALVALVYPNGTRDRRGEVGTCFAAISHTFPVVNAKGTFPTIALGGVWDGGGAHDSITITR